jgi:hypothetical protein
MLIKDSKDRYRFMVMLILIYILSIPYKVFIVHQTKNKLCGL